MGMMYHEQGAIQVTLINERGQTMHEFYVAIREDGEVAAMVDARIQVRQWCDAVCARKPTRVLFDFS
jgi:hypothetical protein